MKVEKDLREADGVQDERRNGKTEGNRGAVLQC